MHFTDRVFESPACLQGLYSQTDANSFFSGASRSSVIQCKPGGNCPSRHRGMTRQLSPLSVAEDSAAPILELQNRSPSGICRHSRVERQSRSGRHNSRIPGGTACLREASFVWLLKDGAESEHVDVGLRRCEQHSHVKALPVPVCKLGLAGRKQGWEEKAWASVGTCNVLDN